MTFRTITSRLALASTVTAVGLLSLSCASSEVSDPQDDPDPETPDGAPNPDGVLLSGEPTDNGLEALTILRPSPVDAEDITDGLLLTRLTATLDPTATVGEINAALAGSDARIVTMWTGVPAVSLRIPRATKLAEVEAAAAALEASEALVLVTPAWEVDVRPVVSERAAAHQPEEPRGVLLPQHVTAGNFPAAWNGVEAARAVDNEVVILVPDMYYEVQPHPMIPSQVFVGDPHPITALAPGFYLGNHGFHVSGTIGATRTIDYAGVHPEPDLIEIQSLTLKGVSMIDIVYTIVSAIPETGPFVLNASLAYNDPTFERHDKVGRARETAIWRSLTFESSARFFLAAATGNDGGFSGDAGEGRYSSPFAINRYFEDLRDLAAEDTEASDAEQDGFDTIMSLLTGVDFHPQNILTVGNSLASGAESPTSGRGSDVRFVGADVIAPCVRSGPTCTGGVGMMSGTSMASPQAAGLAAYLMNLDPTLSPTAVRDLIQRGFDENPGGIVDAYYVALATDRTLASAPFRRALLDVTDPDMLEGIVDGVFDEHDLALIYTSIEALDDEGGADDYSRYDLNGNGVTRFLDRHSFDLDANVPPSWDRLTQTIDGEVVEYDERGLGDLDILCYYAYSPLYAGDPTARDDLLRDVCVKGFPPGIVVNDRTSFAVCDADPCDNPRVRDDSVDLEPFSATLENANECEEGIAESNLVYAEEIHLAAGTLARVEAGGEAVASATHLDEENPFIVTSGNAAGNMSLNFEVVDRPAQFTLTGFAEGFATGPDSVAEVEFSIFGPGVQHISRLYATAASPQEPVEWNTTGELAPGFYSIVVDVRASCAPDRNRPNVANSARAELTDAVLILTQ